jgi:hypothetical protein
VSRRVPPRFAAATQAGQEQTQQGEPAVLVALALRFPLALTLTSPSVAGPGHEHDPRRR